MVSPDRILLAVIKAMGVYRDGNMCRFLEHGFSFLFHQTLDDNDLFNKENLLLR